MEYQWVYLEHIEGVKQRFYRITQHPGLFGPTVIREWGRIGTRGSMKATLCEDHKELTQVCAQLFQGKQRRGYQCIAMG